MTFWISERMTTLEQFDLPFEVDSLPLGKFVELDRAHLKDFLELFASQMSLQVLSEKVIWVFNY